MKASVGFIFFMLFLAGLAFVNLKGMKDQSETVVNSASDLAGTAWRPTHIGEMRLQSDSEMMVQFNSDNSVVGYSGCNRFLGDYKFVEGSLEIGLKGATRMVCPEPVNSFEISFMEALQAARILSRVESRLAMRDDKNIILARFVATVNADAEN